MRSGGTDAPPSSTGPSGSAGYIPTQSRALKTEREQNDLLNTMVELEAAKANDKDLRRVIESKDKEIRKPQERVAELESSVVPRTFIPRVVN